MFGALRISDLASGFLFLGRFSHISMAIGVFLIFAFSVKILQFAWQRKGFLQWASRQRAPIVVPKPKVEEEEECDSLMEEWDAKTLRETVKNERRWRKKAVAELERERVAAASAAEETMGMILRLQMEKSAIEMQANQYRRMAEQRQQHDDQVIRYLERMAMDYEEM